MSHGKSSRLLGYVRRRLHLDDWRCVQVSLPHVHLGTEYGGYALVPDRLGPTSVVYSFGIGEDVSFDLAVIERFGCKVHAFDPTPRSLAWVDAQDLPPGFTMRPVGLADYDGVASFAPPANSAHVSHRIVDGAGASTPGDVVQFPVKRLDTLMRELGHGHIDVLKMDIESSEYAVIDMLERSTLRPTQLLVEFHHQMKSVPLSHTKRAISQLNAMGYRCFDVQPTGREFSFIHA
jgi:FkbM family methyltransferase